MQFVTDLWQPIKMPSIRLDRRDVPMSMLAVLKDYELRHWLALIGVALFAAAPVAGIAFGTWVSVSLLASIALLMVSTAVILVPDIVERDAYDEPGEVGRDL